MQLESGQFAVKQHNGTAASPRQGLESQLSTTLSMEAAATVGVATSTRITIITAIKVGFILV